MTLHDKDSISEEMQRFILLAIPSVPYLEALLLLRSAPAPSSAASRTAWLALVSGRRGALGWGWLVAVMVSPFTS
jgi:hypothetical protein